MSSCRGLRDCARRPIVCEHPAALVRRDHKWPVAGSVQVSACLCNGKARYADAFLLLPSRSGATTRPRCSRRVSHSSVDQPPSTMMSCVLSRQPVSRSPKWVLALACCAAAIGCNEPAQPAPQFVPQGPLAQAVTGAAASAVGPEGRFHDDLFSRSEPGELTAAAAQQLAIAWVKDFAPILSGFLEMGRGAPIHIRELTPCHRALYAHAAFERPTAPAPLVSRRPYGAWWLVTLCERNVPAVSLAVSALATDLRLLDGRIVFPSIYGSEFFGIGIPAGHVGEFPASPEAAAGIVAARTGRLVTRVPQLVVGVPDDGPPQAARWRVELDQLLPIQRGGGVTAVREVFVARTGGLLGATQLQTPADTQETFRELPLVPAPIQGESEEAYRVRRESNRYTTRFTRRSSVPIRFLILAPEVR